MMAKPNKQYWGYYLAREAGVRTGVVYPLLNKMVAASWLDTGWEEEADAVDRPPRKYFTLTDDGRRELGAALARAENDRRYQTLNWSYAR